MARTYVLNVSWEERAIAQALGARYDSTLKNWTYTGNNLPAPLQKYAAQDYSWERWVEDDQNKSYQLPAPPEHVFKARDYQMDAAKAIVQSCQKGYIGFLLADDVGLGKTLTSLIGAYGVAKIKGFIPEKKRAKLLIVCPNHSIPNWRNTLRASGVDKIFRVAIINYEKTKKMLSVPDSAAQAKKTRTKNRHIATKGKPLVHWDIIIADESHKMKNIDTAQQAKAFARIARYGEKAATAPFTIWLSATAGQNPIEVGYLAPLFSQIDKSAPSDISKWGDYLVKAGYSVTMGKVGARWNNPQYKKDPAEKQRIIHERAADLKRIRNLLFGPGKPSMRRLPQDIAGWEQLQRVTLPHTLSVKERVMYYQAWTEFSEEYRKIKASRDPKGALAVQMRFRQKISLIKVQSTVEEVIDLVENGKQVAVSVVFKESADLILQALSSKSIRAVEFTGRTKQNGEAEANRLAFQRGQADVIVFSVVDAVSFHASEMLPDGKRGSSKERALVIHDLRYSGIENIQVSGRTHRDGQNSITYFPYFEDTIEEPILRTILSKIQSVHSLSGDSDALIEEIDTLMNSMILHN